MQGKRFGSKTKRGVKLTTFDDKIWVPDKLTEGIVDWYHENFEHPGREGMINTVGKNFKWKGMMAQIKKLILEYKDCQRFKIMGMKKYDKIPLQEEEKDKTEPWQTVHVDTVGPWPVEFQLKKLKVIQTVDIIALTAADWVTHWLEIWPVQDQTAKLAACAFDVRWLCRFLHPEEVVHDNGREFVGFEFQELLVSYGIKAMLMTVCNPQSNSPIERMHLVMGDILRTK
eukprot:2221179-Ditylum_brightwellii.AAC.1